jgi:hypothetical protein
MLQVRIHHFMKTTSLISLVFLSLCLLLTSGCHSVYYSAYEKIGVYKRDLLKKNVIKARDEQAAAQQQFKDALTRLKEITKFDGGKLEKSYNALKSEYEGCVARADAVHKRVKDVETVAADLFAEWEKEIKQINTPSLRDASRQQLTATRQRYQDLHTVLKSAEKTMDPVLVQFKDYVLYLKHNLNAQAIASLKGEVTSIQTEITALIDQMNTSITRADEFVKSMP